MVKIGSNNLDVYQGGVINTHVLESTLTLR